MKLSDYLSQYLSKYLSPKVLFTLDLILSVLSSVIVLLVMTFFSESGYYSGPFALWWIGGSLVFSTIAFLLFKVEKIIVRHMSIRDFLIYVVGILFKEILLLLLVSLTCVFNTTVILAICCDGLLTLFVVVCTRAMMLLAYDFYKTKLEDVKDCKRILVFGTSDKSVSAIKHFEKSKHHRVVGFLSNDSTERNLKIGNIPVYGYSTLEDVQQLVENLTLSAVLFTSEEDVQSEKDGLMTFLASCNVKAMMMPPVGEVNSETQFRNLVRDVKIEDLLGRPEIQISMDEIRSNFKDKVILVTGAAGSIGSELCRQLASFGVKQLILFDNAETPMHNLKLDLQDRFPNLDFVPLIGSIRHKDRLDYAFRTWHPQVVFHAAAYKHVPLMEENPCEAVFANVHGTRLVADKCLQYDVEMMVMISTDKAVNPTNVMGCSKRLAEIYVQSLGIAVQQGKVKGKTKFVTTRFGNVLGSNGSVIPRFREQIENGGPVTVTHPEITRYFMTIPEACRLVMEAATMSSGNQIFVFDMGEPVRILDLAKRMIKLAGLKEGEDIQIMFTGLRPGEKLYEEVLANSENTLPTSHDRIRIAQVREYDYEEALAFVDQLAELSKEADVPEMIKLMKKIVPEFKSKNSIFEQYDRIKV